jgi:hypothetical protein
MAKRGIKSAYRYNRSRTHRLSYRRHRDSATYTRYRIAYSLGCCNGSYQKGTTFKRKENLMAENALGVLVAVVGLASLAVIVSKRSNTAAVLTAGLNGFSSNIRAAVSPVTA